MRADSVLPGGYGEMIHEINESVAAGMGQYGGINEPGFNIINEVSPNEIAEALGKAIGKPELKWLAIPDEQLLNGMLSMGMNETIAKGFIEMQAKQDTGEIYEDYNTHQPEMGSVKIKDFAEEFAAAALAN